MNPAELDFLLRFPAKTGVTSPVDFLQHQGWGAVKVGLCSRQLCQGNASTALGQGVWGHLQGVPEDEQSPGVI